MTFQIVSALSTELPESAVPHAIEEIRRGRMVVVCDGEERENEGGDERRGDGEREVRVARELRDDVGGEADAGRGRERGAAVEEPAEEDRARQRVEHREAEDEDVVGDDRPGHPRQRGEEDGDPGTTVGAAGRTICASTGAPAGNTLR